MGQDQPNGPDSTRSTTVYAYAAPVEVRAGGEGGSDLLAIAKKRALDPEAFDEFPPFFFRVVPSTDRLDSYFTVMDTSSLKNYGEDFEEGRAFQDSHRHNEMPLGYSLTGKFIGGQGNGQSRVEADFFISRGIFANGDAAIARLRTGTVRDVSIGFYGGQWVCSICGRDMLADWDCWHIPGFSYDPNARNPWDDPDNAAAADRAKSDPKDKGEKVLCSASIRNANAAECSGVYDGATPGAVVKAIRMAEAGRLPPAQARIIESRYQVRINGADHTWRGIALPIDTRSRQEGATMTFEEQVRELLALGADADAIDTIRSLKAKADRVDAAERSAREVRTAFVALGAPDGGDIPAWANAEFARLRPLADDGTKYRGDLIKDALEEGVRALGNEFQTETYRGAISGLPIDAIKRFRDDWKAQGDAVLAGSRQTIEDHEPTPINNARKSKRALAGV